MAKNPILTQATRAMILMIVLAIPSSSIASRPGTAASGTYLNESNWGKYIFDNVTNSLTYIGQDTESSVCTDSSTTHMQRCGNCTYVSSTPDPNLTWEDPLAQYTQGRCANVDAANTAKVQTREDVRLTNNSVSGGQQYSYWKYSYLVMTDAAGHDTKLVLDAPFTCAMTLTPKVFNCDGRPASIYDIQSALISASAVHYCVHAEVYNVTVTADPYTTSDLGVSPEEFASACV